MTCSHQDLTLGMKHGIQEQDCRCKHGDLHLIPNPQVKEPGMMACTYNPKNDRARCIPGGSVASQPLLRVLTVSTHVHLHSHTGLA